jgi:hypothetical protein
MENCCRWEKVHSAKETATMLFLPIKQIRTQPFVQGFGPHPQITLGEGRLLQRAGTTYQSCSATTTTGSLDVEGVMRLEIYLNYTRPTLKTATTNYPLRRVSKIGDNLDRLAFQVLKTRSDPEWKPTFDFYNQPSDYEGNETEVSDTKGEEKYEKHTETYTTANMSSEKASNPKDKLEGTYPSRVWGLPPFYASIYLTVMLILS